MEFKKGQIKRRVNGARPWSCAISCLLFGNRLKTFQQDYLREKELCSSVDRMIERHRFYCVPTTLFERFYADHP